MDLVGVIVTLVLKQQLFAVLLSLFFSRFFSMMSGLIL